MQVRGLRTRRQRTVASAAVLLLAVAGFAIAVLTSKGYATVHLSLNDGGVWVTNRAMGYVGRFIRPIEQLDAMVEPSQVSSPEIDVIQEAETVFVVDTEGGLLRRMNVADVELAPDGPALPAAARVGLGGSVVAILDPETGDLWVRTADEVAALDIETDEPTVTVGGDADVAVGRDGIVHAVSAETDRRATVRLDARRMPIVDIEDLDVDLAEARITAVGDRPVILDEDGRLVLPGGAVVPVGGGDDRPVLQQPGPAADHVLVATTRALLRIGLGGGSPVEVVGGRDGAPAAPVRLGGCAYGAWGGDEPSLFRDCGAMVSEPPQALTEARAGAEFRFRVNRDAIVLNDVGTGDLFLFERSGVNLGNWEQLRRIIPEPDPDQPTNVDPVDPDVNRQPIARPDEFGARAGQAADLPVLDNDGDPDGDILVIRSVSGVPAEAGRLNIIHNGQLLQFVASPTWTGAVQFRYTIDDGRGGSAFATVTVRAHPRSQNQSPEARPIEEIPKLESGGTYVTNALRNWRDPDGDRLVLVSATAPAGDRVRYTPSGELTFIDGGETTGRKQIDILVGDGVGAPVPGAISIDVLPAGTSEGPNAEDDLVLAVVGQELTIHPLDNDTDPNTSVPGAEQRLRLSRVDEIPGAVVTPDYTAGTIAFTGLEARSYVFGYEITDGQATARATIRVEVHSANTNSPPVAVADHGVLRGSAPTVVDVLSNDVDADGDVLVVQSFTVAPTAGVSVAVIEQRWLRVISTQDASGSTAIRYVVSDGTNSDEGVLEITRLPVAEDNQPPSPRDDFGTVRVGDVITIAVLDNDSDPEGGLLTLDPSIVPNDDRGTWLVADRLVRYQAPDTPGTSTATYTVRDDNGTSGVAQVTVTVKPRDDEHNQPPQPPTLTARAIAGSVIRVKIPLTGVDPDGDSTVLLGPSSAPRIGRVVGQGVDYIDYEAYIDGSGTDEFTYRLQDPLGGRGTGIIRVGVAAPAQSGSAPVAIDDVYTVSPGVTVKVPVLANDSDVDGDPLQLEELAPLNPALPEGVQFDGDRLVVRAGGDGSTVYVRYGVSDGRGQRASATVVIHAREGANLAPIARDDLGVVEGAGATSVDVDVLLNDEDLDGDIFSAQVEPIDVGDAPPTQVIDGNKLRIALLDAPRQIAYRVTDRSGGTAIAFVRVPGTGNQAPVLLPDAKVTLAGGTDVEVVLADVVSDPEGAVVRLTTGTAISTSPANSLSLVPGSVALDRFTIRAAPEFRGRASVIFEVTDGASANDDDAATISLALPVTVTPATPQPLDFWCPPAEPRAGSHPVFVDLRSCVPGLDEQERQALRFSEPEGAPAGVEVTLHDGQRLEIAAALDAAVDSPATLAFSVTDSAGQTSDASLDVIVRTAAFAIATTDVVDNVHAGDEVRVDVTANDVNPFRTGELRLVDADVASGDVTATVDGRFVVVRSTDAFHGRAVVNYDIEDATGEASRRVTGQVLVNVVGRPDAPAAPVQRTVGDGVAVIAWPEPNNNGAPILDYTVEATDADFSQVCTTTVCELTGLENGRVYHFVVRARNVVGVSEPSPPSGDIRPDVKPDQPAPPIAQFGDSQISLTWVQPASRGSAVERYEVEVSPDAGGGTRTTSSTSLVWNGLTNGVSYTFRVRAYNASDMASEWSAPSAPEVPARAPEPPAAPTAAGVADGVGEQIVVSWGPPATNGAPITAYHVAVTRAGALQRVITVDGDATQATVDVENGVQYTFAVSATNKAGESARGPSSAPVVAHGRPFPVAQFSLQDSDGPVGYDRRIAFSITPPDDNGMAISRYEFDLNGTGTAQFVAGGASGFITGLTNGSSYTVSVRACNDFCGDWSSPSGAIVPYGPVPNPGAGASRFGQTQVRLTYSPPGGTNGRPINRVEIRIDGGGWENVGLSSGERIVGNGPSQLHTIDVRAIDSEGQVSGVVSASAMSEPPRVVVSSGANAQGQPGCGSSLCRFIVVELINFPPNTGYSCTFNSSLGSDGFGTMTGTTNGSGHDGPRQSANYFGGAVNPWVEVTCNGVTGRKDGWP